MRSLQETILNWSREVMKSLPEILVSVGLPNCKVLSIRSKGQNCVGEWWEAPSAILQVY